MIKEQIRNAIIRTVKGSGLSRIEFAERADVRVPVLMAYMSDSVDFRTPSIETLVRIALASDDPDAFILSLLPPDAKRGEWTSEDKLGAVKATERMAREAFQMVKNAGSDEEAESRLHSCFAACYLMAYDDRVTALRERGE